MIILAPNDVAPLIARGIKEALDNDEWPVMRLAELRAAGERAKAVVQWARRGEGFAFAVKIRREDGSIESPLGTPGAVALRATADPAPRTHPPCAYCEADAVSGLAIEHNGLHFCSVGCLWDAAYCDGFDTALDKVREKKFEPLGEVLAELELETINTAPRRTPRKGSSRS